MTIVNPCLNQSSIPSFDDANGFFRVKRGLNSKSRWNKAKIFAAVIEPELLFYASDISCVTDVTVIITIVIIVTITIMTKGTTVLIQTDQAKGSQVSNYRPIACLPIMWRLFTGILGEKLYVHLERNGLLTDDQKGRRK